MRPSSITRRNFLFASATLAGAAIFDIPNKWMAPDPVAATTTTDCTPSPPVPTTDTTGLPYTADSFFKSSVAGAPVDASATAAFHTFMQTHPDQRSVPYPKITGTGSNQWGTTFAVGTANDPVWHIASGYRTETAILHTQGFHMADEIASHIPTGTQDRPFLIVDEAFGYSLFCGDVVPNVSARTITVGMAAVFWHTSNGLDKRNPRSDDARNWASRGRIPDSTVIRRDRLDQAIASNTGLGYVLEMFFVETDSAAGFCHPMVGAENGQSGWGAEGTRIAIRPDVDLPSRGLTGGALAVARTLQENGCYLGDNSGSSSTLKGEQSTPSYNPWAGTNIAVNCLQGYVTWDDWFVLPRGWQ